MPDDLTSALEDIKKRAGFESACTAAPFGTRSCDDAVSLVAAIEAVLKLADSAEPVAQEWVPGHGHRFYTWTLDPAKVRETISRSLSCKEESNG